MISIIVPVYKVEGYLHQCVDSILRQTYQDIEILLIDDGSPDRCGEICEEYTKRDSRIRVFHTENCGLSAARNLGLRKAKGDYIGFVDSDDWIEPDMYEVLFGRMEDTGADVCMCGLWFDYSGASVSSVRRASKEIKPEQAVYHNRESMAALIDGKITNMVWNKLYRKELFEKLSFPEGNFEDIASMHRIIGQCGSFAVISAPKYHYLQRAGSISKTQSAQNLIDYANACLDRYYYLKNEYPGLFYEKQEEILRNAAAGISKTWRWWFGCSRDEKQEFETRIKELEIFSREHFPLTGYRLWPAYLRLSTIFMHSDNTISFAVLYSLNQIYRKLQKVRGGIHWM